MLQHFHMENCKPAHILLPEGFHLVSETDTPKVDPTCYCEIVGSLLYYAITCTDLQFAIGLVSRFMVRPQQAHLDACLHILRYVSKTLDFGILYKADSRININGYTNVDWGACEDTQRSTWGLFIHNGK